MEIRPATAEDAARVREVAAAAFEASYRFDAETADRVVDEQFGDPAFRTRASAPDAVVLVAEADERGADGSDPTVVGVCEADMAEGRGDVRWLLVDPDHRGRGAGTALFESAVAELDERGARHVQASVLGATREGEEFLDRQGYERVDRREVDLAGETFEEAVFRPVEDRADDGG